MIKYPIKHVIDRWENHIADADLVKIVKIKDNKELVDAINNAQRYRIALEQIIALSEGLFYSKDVHYVANNAIKPEENNG